MVNSEITKNNIKNKKSDKTQKEIPLTNRYTPLLDLASNEHVKHKPNKPTSKFDNPTSIFDNPTSKSDNPITTQIKFV